MKHFIKRLAFLKFHYLGLNTLYVHWASKNKLTLLRYHSVADLKNAKELKAELYPQLSVKVGDFRKQLLWLKKRGYNFLNFSDLETLRNNNQPLPPRPIIVYFDDGYKDNLLNAAPVLRELNIPATLFITTSFIEGTHELWSMRIRQIILNSNHTSFKFNGRIFDGTGEVVIKKIINEGKLRTPTDKLEAETQLLATQAGVESPLLKNIFLSWDEIQTLSDVFEFGAHGVSHNNLTKLSEAEIKRELSDSKTRIETLLKKPVIAFSYPHGAYNDRIENLASQYYRYLITTDDGLNSAAANWYCLQAIKAPTTSSLAEFTSEVGLWNYIRQRRTKRNGETINRQVWEGKASVSQYIQPPHLSLPEQKLVESFKTAGARKILDIGCGTGRTTKVMKDMGFEVVGTDYSVGMIAQAKLLYPDIDFKVMDAAALQYPTESFDAVLFSFNGLDYLYPESKRFQALKEILRVLKPGGLFAYSSHNAWLLPLRRTRALDWLRNLVRGRAFARYRYDYQKFGTLLTYYGSPPYQRKTLEKVGFEFVSDFGGKKHSNPRVARFLDPYLHYIFRKPR